MIRTLTPALARPLAHIKPAGPAPMTRTSTSDCFMRLVGIARDSGRTPPAMHLINLYWGWRFTESGTQVRWLNSRRQFPYLVPLMHSWTQDISTLSSPDGSSYSKRFTQKTQNAGSVDTRSHRIFPSFLPRKYVRPDHGIVREHMLTCRVCYVNPPIMVDSIDYRWNPVRIYVLASLLYASNDNSQKLRVSLNRILIYHAPCGNISQLEVLNQFSRRARWRKVTLKISSPALSNQVAGSVLAKVGGLGVNLEALLIARKILKIRHLKFLS